MLNKFFLIEYIRYHQWANAELLNAMFQLSKEEQQRPVPGSFPGLYATVLHLWWAESVWWQRVSGEQLSKDADPFDKDVEALGKGLILISSKWQNWLQNLTDEEFVKNLEYSNSKGHFNQPLPEVIFHLFQHGSYHRGQLVTLLRQLGQDKIPTTDYIAWMRLGKPGPSKLNSGNRDE